MSELLELDKLIIKHTRFDYYKNKWFLTLVDDMTIDITERQIADYFDDKEELIAFLRKLYACKTN